MTAIVAVDMFVVATATFRMPYAMIVLDHNRSRVIHFEIIRNPTQVWLAQQITEAFPWDTAPRKSAPRLRHVIWPLLPESCSSDGH